MTALHRKLPKPTQLPSTKVFFSGKQWTRTPSPLSVSTIMHHARSARCQVRKCVILVHYPDNDARFHQDDLSENASLFEQFIKESDNLASGYMGKPSLKAETSDRLTHHSKNLWMQRKIVAELHRRGSVNKFFWSKFFLLLNDRRRGRNICIASRQILFI